MAQGDPIDKVLDALEVANREAQRQGPGGGIHGPAAEILSGIHQLRGSAAQQKTKEPLHEKSHNKEASKNRQIGSLKAELVRNQIVTRGDLMKLYQPPIKKSQLPTANPFLSKNLLDPIPTEPSSGGVEKPNPANYTSFGDIYATEVPDP